MPLYFLQLVSSIIIYCILATEVATIELTFKIEVVRDYC